MVSSERILIELLRDAGHRGAIALNYAPVLDIVTEANTATGVRVRNARTDEIHVLRGKAIVDCAGPHVRALPWNRADADRLFRPSLAFNVLLDVNVPSRHALAVSPPGPNAPMLFLIPQQGTLLAGTMHLSRPRETTTAHPTDGEVDLFLQLLRRAVPDLPLSRTNVRRMFAGLLPATEVGGTRLRRREVIVDHGRAGGVQRVYSVSGVKFTTANRVARKTLVKIGHSSGADEDGSALPLSPATTVVTDAGTLWTLEDQALRSALRTLIQEEGVCSLDDLVLRRTNWATTEVDLEGVRARVKQLVDLPSDVSSPHRPAATSALSDSF
jgi:glycerol-3-phosphate dehydrogenase